LKEEIVDIMISLLYLIWLYPTPLSAIYQLYHGDQF